MVQLLQLVFQEVARQSQRRSHNSGSFWSHVANIPWIPVFSSIIATVGWVLWVVYAERARHETHAVVEAFGLSLVHEPWPLWSTLPVCLGLLKATALFVSLTLWRSHIERARDSKGPLFHAGHAQRYFIAGVMGNTFVWLMMAGVMATLVGHVVWLVAAVALERAAGQVTGDTGNAVLEAVSVSAATPTAGDLLDSAIASVASVFGANPDPAEAPNLSGWVPDYPASVGCMIGCFDLSGFAYYLGDKACLCNWVSGWGKAQPHAHKAACYLTCALAGLSMLYVAGTWIVMNLACQFSHTQSEALQLMDEDERQTLVVQQAKVVQATFGRKQDPSLLEDLPGPGTL